MRNIQIVNFPAAHRWNRFFINWVSLYLCTIADYPKTESPWKPNKSWLLTAQLNLHRKTVHSQADVLAFLKGRGFSMTSNTHKRSLLLPIKLVLLLTVVSGIFVYAPASMMLLDAPVPCWAFFLAIILLLGKSRTRHYWKHREKVESDQSMLDLWANCYSSIQWWWNGSDLLWITGACLLQSRWIDDRGLPRGENLDSNMGNE